MAVIRRNSTATNTTANAKARPARAPLPNFITSPRTGSVKLGASSFNVSKSPLPQATQTPPVSETGSPHVRAGNKRVFTPGGRRGASAVSPGQRARSDRRTQQGCHKFRGRGRRDHRRVGRHARRRNRPEIGETQGAPIAAPTDGGTAAWARHHGCLSTHKILIGRTFHTLDPVGGTDPEIRHVAHTGYVTRATLANVVSLAGRSTPH